MTVTIVGCGDAFGSGGRFQTCFAIETAGRRVLVDCGASSLIAMRRMGMDPLAIEAIVLSHLHGDHFGGLPFFILDAQFVSKRTAPLTIAGPPGTEIRVTQAMETFFPGSSTVARRFETRFVEMPVAVSSSVGPVQVRPTEVIHGSGAPAYALRIEAPDGVVGYSGDTEWTDVLYDVAQGADLFICEASTYDTRVPGHIAYTSLLKHRRRFDCKRLLLTHMGPDVLAHLADLEIEAAADGQVIRL